MQNLSKDWARVELTVELAYHINVDEALTVIKTLADKLYNAPKGNDKIIEAPEVLGIDEFDPWGFWFVFGLNLNRYSTVCGARIPPASEADI
ncbi:hypothetical protein [Microcoleus sp. FACHB-672]|uniref:hypothetical protein n=1 Tax=Microcoleus sp. FACHB-672 TaxID=2692825 RepID=UPI0016829FD5|nr:hypothetical protein [Microcoleus sp. FACHB-672]MBD2040597.1 hypothetical protein [Microcoleus sp. FACHB-672]